MIRTLTLLTLTVGVYGWEPVDAPAKNDRALIAAVIIAEAGGEGKMGCAAVYEVIHTRASHRRTSCTIEVMRRKQFSCLNNTSPEGLIRRVSTHKHYKWVRDELLGTVPLTMFTVQKNTHKLNRNRADHYYAHKKIAKPYWVGASRGKVIGGHTFYKLTK